MLPFFPFGKSNGLYLSRNLLFTLHGQEEGGDATYEVHSAMLRQHEEQPGFTSSRRVLQPKRTRNSTISASIPKLRATLRSSEAEINFRLDCLGGRDLGPLLYSRFAVLPKPPRQHWPGADRVLSPARTLWAAGWPTAVNLLAAIYMAVFTQISANRASLAVRLEPFDRYLTSVAVQSR
jgi:hypothetical protein